VTPTTTIRCSDVARKLGPLFLLALGCADPSPDEADATSTSTSSTSTTSTTAEPTTIGGGTSDSSATTRGADTSDDGSTDTGAPPDVGKGEVRFIAMGDAGEGNQGQYEVAAAVATVCEERGCDFALYLGDNIYDVGVTSAMDEQFDAKFEQPYAVLDFPFYVTLGNHDYGFLGNEWNKGDYQIEYSTISDKWTLPAEYYSFQQQNAHFVSLNTAQLFWDYQTSDQQLFLTQDLAGLEDTWIIAFGHHPYLSNGEHGNAGNYEGLGGLIGGATLKEFFEESICGKVHVYICGHDHNRQWPLAQCGTEFIVSGGGSKLTELVHRDDNPTLWEDDQTEGFLWVEIVDNTFTGVFYDKTATPQYERTLTL
jgi:hypothetical protein